MVEAEQQHGVGEPQPDPEDAEQRAGDRQRDVAAQRAHDRHQRSQQHRAREREHHLELVAVGRRRDQARQADEAGERQRAHGRQQPVQLVQRHEPEPDHQQGEQRAVAGEHHHDRDDRPRQGDHDTRARSTSSAVPAAAGRGQDVAACGHYLPPNRYSREP